MVIYNRHASDNPNLLVKIINFENSPIQTCSFSKINKILCYQENSCLSFYGAEDVTLNPCTETDINEIKNSINGVKNSNSTISSNGNGNGGNVNVNNKPKIWLYILVIGIFSALFIALIALVFVVKNINSKDKSTGKNVSSNNNNDNNNGNDGNLGDNDGIISIDVTGHGNNISSEITQINNNITFNNLNYENFNSDISEMNEIIHDDVLPPSYTDIVSQQPKQLQSSMNTIKDERINYHSEKSRQPQSQQTQLSSSSSTDNIKDGNKEKYHSEKSKF